MVRSHYSFLNSTLSVPAIVEQARASGSPAVALCDQGNLHGAVEFTVAAQAAGLKPILGAEVRCQGDPLWLFVESQAGYANLCRLLSSATPAADRDEAVSEANAGGERAAMPWRSLATLAGDATAGLVVVGCDPRLAASFPGRFYRAIRTRRELREQAGNPEGPPAVPVFPVHYARPEERWQFDIVQSIRTLTLLRQAHPEKVEGGNHHFRTPVELDALFGRYPRLAAATWEIADRCQFAIRLGRPQFPPYRTPDGLSSQAFLRQLVERGLAARYPSDRRAALRAQVDEELAMITAVGYEDYFLVVWDLLTACRARGIDWITRGSAADSLVCYCLGISGVCPVRFDLYFRRFLNIERMGMNKLPDIDIDFPHDRKDDVVELLFERHGPEHCAVVGGFSTFQARSAFAEVAKVLGVAERDVRRFTEHFPWGFGGSWIPGQTPEPSREREAGGRLIEMLRESPECRDLPLDEEPYRTALAMAGFLDGVPRYPKMHPCGVVLSRQPMHELTPTFVSQKGWRTTHFDMDGVEDLGLVKLDVLAQGGLAVMRDVRTMLDGRGVGIDLDHFTTGPLMVGAGAGLARQRTSEDDEVPLLVAPPAPPWKFDDPEIWDLIAGGQARAVHHIESPAMTSLCRMCNVRDIDTLVAIVSVIRPGAANEDKKREFTRRYQGLSPVTYPHPSLEPALRSTFGLVVYEEHILQICEAFAGLSGGRADVLRRALVKERIGVVREIAPEFAAAARARGRTPEEIAAVWTLVTGFHGYAFCKAHSTAYGVEAYQSAWLKRHFPAEFMAGVLTNGKGFYRPLVYVLECHRLGVPLLSPCVNHPGPGFTVVETPPMTIPAGAPANVPRRTVTRAIRVPIREIQLLTRATKERIEQERSRGAFASLTDFYLRVHPPREDMEILSRAGAFDGFGPSRCLQFWEIQKLHRRYGTEGISGQHWLLPPAPGGGTTAGGPEGLGEVPLSEPTRLQQLQGETELLGYPASGHPLELYPGIAWDTYCPVSRLGQFVGQEITLCGLVIEDRVHHQVTGEAMKFLTLADWTGMIETELFARTYKTYGLATVRYPVLEVMARVEAFENGRGLTLRVMRAGPPRAAGGSGD